MRIARHSFALPFVGGFLIGAAGLAATQPGQVTRALASHLPQLHSAR